MREGKVEGRREEGGEGGGKKEGKMEDGRRGEGKVEGEGRGA